MATFEQDYRFKPGVTVSVPNGSYVIDESILLGVLKKRGDIWYTSSETMRLIAPVNRDEPKTKRGEILDEAKSLTNGDRNNQYGEPIDDFTRIADALNALGYRAPHDRPMQPHDVSVIQITVKMSRIVNSPQKMDSWVDAAGYAAVGGEVADIEGKRE